MPLACSDYTVEERPSEMLLIQELESGRSNPLVFVLNANLLAMVSMVNCKLLFFVCFFLFVIPRCTHLTLITRHEFETDVNRKCWCLTTKGMHAVGQAELVVLLQCLPEEKSFPRDIFSHFVQLYRDSLTGEVISLGTPAISHDCINPAVWQVKEAIDNSSSDIFYPGLVSP